LPSPVRLLKLHSPKGPPFRERVEKKQSGGDFRHTCSLQGHFKGRGVRIVSIKDTSRMAYSSRGEGRVSSRGTLSSTVHSRWGEEGDKRDYTIDKRGMLLRDPSELNVARVHLNRGFAPLGEKGKGGFVSGRHAQSVRTPFNRIQNFHNRPCGKSPRP